MTLFRDDPDVSWKLNDLLEASKKAKLFAEDSLIENNSKEFNIKDYSSSGLQADQVDSAIIDSHSEVEKEKDIALQKDVNLSDTGQELNNDSTDQEPSLDKKDPRKLNEIPEHEEELKRIEQTAFKEGYEKGLKEGAEKRQNEVREFELDYKKVLKDIEKQAVTSNQLYEPLKKLSTAIAVQMVRGELSLSALAIERLITACIAQLDSNEKSDYLIYVSEFDMNQIEKFGIKIDAQLLKTDSRLSKGSVRLSMGDMIIEDLIETRLAEISEIIFKESTNEFDEAHDSSEADTRTSNSLTEGDPDVLDAEILAQEKEKSTLPSENLKNNDAAE